MIKQYFVKQGIKEATIEDFIRTNFPVGDYSKTELQRTPMGLKVVIWTNKPGKIIGRGGQTINEITEALKNEFKLENLQLDVKLIENPDLDAKIVAKQIASALEKGYNFKKIGNLTLKRIMAAGAMGAEIVISGCMGGAKSMSGKFSDGYLKHCGHPSKELVEAGHEVAYTKRATIGVQVKVMREFVEVTGEKRTHELVAKAKEKVIEEREEAPSEEAGPEAEKEAKPKEKEPKKPKPKAEKKPKARGA
ncbi:MAG: 30S ribosomal protein S3 [Candidatus Aenigmatarchaeota archaeon]